jgi:uncharacterized protein (DUF58 family)
VPTTRLWVVAGVASGAAVVGGAFGVEEFVLLALAAGVVVAWGALTVRWRARRLRGELEVVVDVPVPEAGVGDTVVARVVLSGAGRALPPLRLEDPRGRWVLSHPGLGGRPVAEPSSPSPSGPRPGRAVALGGIRPTRPVELAVAVPTDRRGVRTLEGVSVFCDDPFGLFLLNVATVPAARLLVCPRPGRAGGPPEGRRGGGSRRTPEVRGPASKPAGDELDRLRPYVPGDRLSRLHWQALARSGDLIVREFGAGDLGRIALLLDVRPGADAALFEAAVEEVAAIGLGALVAGSAVELCTSAGERLDVPPGASGPATLLRALAMVGPALPARQAQLRWGEDAAPDALWATDNVADAGQVLVTARPGDRVLPEALSPRTSVVVVR